MLARKGGDAMTVDSNASAYEIPSKTQRKLPKENLGLSLSALILLSFNGGMFIIIGTPKLASHTPMQISFLLIGIFSLLAAILIAVVIFKRVSQGFEFH